MANEELGVAAEPSPRSLL